MPAATVPSPATARRRPPLAALTSAAIGLAALVAVVLVQRRPADDPHDLVAKGGAVARLYLERDGRVASWDEARGAKPGERIRAEVSAAAPQHAYFAVVDRDGKLLTPLARVAASHLALAAGQTAAFPGAIGLDDADAGELAVVLACPEAAGVAGESELASAVARTLAARGATPAGRSVDAGDGCEAWIFALRGGAP
jgi:hypothetical protein